MNMGPFVKWAGGKGQLVERLISRIPARFGTYYEPFIGGGAVLLELRPENAIVSDVNEQLINVYNQLQHDARNVIREVRHIEETPCSREYYYAKRDRYNEKIMNHELDAECAGLMIWINKHCFNGLYRVNAQGLFNVPYNGNDRANSIDETNLIDIGNFLNFHNINILVQDFEETCNTVEAGDFVYFDSPYIPISDTAGFTDYTRDGFSYEDHVRLARLFAELDHRGAHVMLSNNNVPLTYELYHGFRIETVEVRRNINSDPDNRRGTEVIITNYDTVRV